MSNSYLYEQYKFQGSVKLIVILSMKGCFESKSEVDQDLAIPDLFILLQ